MTGDRERVSFGRERESERERKNESIDSPERESALRGVKRERKRERERALTGERKSQL